MSTANGTTHGKLTLEQGLVSVSIGGNAWMDAHAGEVATDLSAIELSIEEARCHIGPRDDYRGELTLSMDMDRHTMSRLFYLLAAKMSLPAFNERQWRMIADALRAHAVSGSGEVFQMADEIERAYR